MTDVIFMLHGMGHHKKDDWNKGAVDTLKAEYNKYKRLAAKDFDERFRIVSIEYDSIFRSYVEAWQENATAVGDLAKGIDVGKVDSMVGWLRNAGDLDDNFVWSHAADVVLYRAYFNIRQEIKVHVANQMILEINKLKFNERWSVIAHSLGTAVINDTLHMIWTGQHPDGSATGFEPRHQQARCVAMVANVSRVLQSGISAYDSTLRPGPSGSNSSGCINFLNFRHKLDPFTIPRMFNPVDWPSTDPAINQRFQNIKVAHIHEKNVHDLDHYLKNPEVNIPLLRALTWDTAITIDQARQAFADFKQFGELGSGKGISIREGLEAIQGSLSDDWLTLGERWDKFHNFL